MSIRSRIILGFLLAILLTAASAAVLSALQMRGDATENFNNSAQRQLVLLDNHLDDFIEGIKGNVGVLIDSAKLAETWSDMPLFKDKTSSANFVHAELTGAASESIRVMTSMHRRHQEYVEVYAGFPDGRFATSCDGSSIPAGYDSSLRGWYTKGRDSSSEITFVDAYLSTSGETVIAAVGKVKDQSGKFVATVGIDVTLKNLAEMIRKLNFGKSGHFLLIEHTGRVLCDPRNAANTGKMIGQEISNEALSTLKAAGDGPIQLSYNGVDTYGVVHTAKCGWKIVAMQDRAEIMQKSNQALLHMLLIVAAVSFLLILLGLLIARSINKPLSRLVTSMGEVADGNYKAVPDKAGFYKELLILRNALSKMVKANVHAMAIAQKKTKEAERAVQDAETATARAEEAARRAENAKREGMLDAAEKLEGMVSGISAAATELSAQIEESDRGAVESSERLSQAATAMNEMNATVQEVAHSASQAAQVSGDTRTNAEDGQKILADAMSSINLVQKVSMELRDDMSTLHGHTQNISQIMNVISDIADQTNLLALNAAIEAARAGEAGRGFAVVADEVRKLAEKTMSSTNDVSHAITAIQESAQQSVNRMEEALNDVEQATKLAEQSGTALTQIVRNVEDTADQVRAIATASEEQSAASDEINRSITTVNEMSAQTTQAMNEAAKAISELARQTEDLSSLIEEMKRA
ncbi:MAG: methyl-accepting chemotaxis protein [Desulfovibrio sp.]|nr:methyl-accepting chemotaxis protein [Desulfovibrio sp.]